MGEPQLPQTAGCDNQGAFEQEAIDKACPGVGGVGGGSAAHGNVADEVRAHLLSIEVPRYAPNTPWRGARNRLERPFSGHDQKLRALSDVDLDRFLNARCVQADPVLIAVRLDDQLKRVPQVPPALIQ